MFIDVKRVIVGLCGFYEGFGRGLFATEDTEGTEKRGRMGKRVEKRMR